MQNTALDWHIFKLLQGQQISITILGTSHEFSAAALGLGAIGLTRLVPIFCLSLIGGMAADTQNRRKILFWTQLIAAVVAALMALISLVGAINIAIIYALNAALSATAAFGNPSRQALIPSLVPRPHLTNALGLNSMAMNLGQVLGPALGGLLLHWFDPGVVYACNAISFAAVLVAVIIMRHPGNAPVDAAPASFKSMFEGFRFVRRTPMIWSTMLLDALATFFSSASSMLPLVAGDILNLSAAGYGILRTGQAVGSVLASLVVSLRPTIQRQGLVLLVAVVIYGLATALFGLSTLAVASYLLYAAIGAADTVSTVIRGTVRQLLTPDNMRGRMVGVNMLFFMGGPQLGELEAGAVAAAFGVPFSIISGGVLTVVLALWVAHKYPVMRKFELAQAILPA